MISSRIYGARLSGRAPSLAGRVGLEPIVLPSPAATADVRQWCTFTEDQLGEQCVGEAFEGAHWVAVRNAGKRLSPLSVWTGARARERMRAGDALLNVGCDPADAVDSMVVVGAYPRDARDDNPADLTDVETWTEAAASQLFLPEQFLPIETGDTDTIDRVLTAGFGVVNWMPVDMSFETLGAGVTWQGMIGPTLGGHATLLCAKLENGDYVIHNSWSVRWSSGGFGTVARSVIAKTAGLCGVVGGPVF